MVDSFIRKCRESDYPAHCAYRFCGKICIYQCLTMRLDKFAHPSPL